MASSFLSHVFLFLRTEGVKGGALLPLTSNKKKQPNRKGSRNVEATQNTKELQDLAISLFREKYLGGAIRQIGISGNQLSDSSVKQLSLFESVQENQTNKKQESLQKAIDEIRETFDFLSIQKASSLSEGSRVIYRNKLIGGHAASKNKEDKNVS